MAISINVALTIDDIGLSGGRIYRVDDHGVVVHGNLIASFNDDGVVFKAIEYETAPGGFGEVDPYFVHDNGDGTMNVYYRLTSAGLPLTHADVYVTLNAETGARIGPTHDLPYSQFGDLGAMGHTDASGHANGQLLQQAISLSDGTIALVDTANILNQFVFKIVNPDGTAVALSSSLGSGIFNHDSQLLFDLTEVGEKVAVVWTEYAPGATGAPVHLRLMNKDGGFGSAEILLGDTSSSPFGNTPSAQVETLADGRILVVWVENGTDSGPDTDQTSTWFSILNADGSESVAATLVNTEVTKAREDTPLVIVTEEGFVIGYSVLDFAGIQEGRLKEYDANGVLLDTETGAYLWGSDDIVRTDNNTAFIIGGNVYEITLPGADTPFGSGVAGETLTGTSGHNSIIGGAGDDILRGFEGNDTLRGEGGQDLLYGGAGSDRLIGGLGNDELFGDRGNDLINGGAGNDRVVGGDGVDTLRGEAGNDTLIGGNGNDVLFGSDGSDVLNGGGGRDVANYFGAALGVRVVLQNAALNTNHAAGDTLFSVENLTGTAFNDDLRGNKFANDIRGNNGADTLTGNGGNDRLFGGNGNDVLFGGDGSDVLNGGGGRDVANYFGAELGVRVVLQNVSLNTNHAAGDTFFSVENLTGTAFNDDLRGNKFANDIRGNNGADTLTGNGGNDRLFGGNGNDRLFGNAGNDRLEGGNQTDLLYGGGGVDTLYGGNGTDRLYGGNSDDRLFGGNQNDTLVGGNGDDLLNGGAGSDTLVFKVGFGDDTANGFTNDQDTLRLESNLWTGTLTAQGVLNEFAAAVGDDALFTFDGGETLRLVDYLVTNALASLVNDIDIF